MIQISYNPKFRSDLTHLPDFEKSLRELESLVERMEQGEISLEQSLKDFERGIELTRQCQTALQQAEQRVQQLISKNGQDELVPFEED
ncbi:MAG: exodeoxyribonuclease VII small subunit [Gammaproteobacteria bacterium]